MPRDFFDLTISELVTLLQHREDSEVRELRNIRYLAASSLNSNPYLKKHYKPSDLFKLSGDPVVKPMTKEEFDESVRKAKKALPFNIA